MNTIDLLEEIDAEEIGKRRAAATSKQSGKIETENDTTNKKERREQNYMMSSSSSSSRKGGRPMQAKNGSTSIGSSSSCSSTTNQMTGNTTNSMKTKKRRKPLSTTTTTTGTKKKIHKYVMDEYDNNNTSENEEEYEQKTKWGAPRQRRMNNNMLLKQLEHDIEALRQVEASKSRTRSHSTGEGDYKTKAHHHHHQKQERAMYDAETKYISSEGRYTEGRRYHQKGNSSGRSNSPPKYHHQHAQQSPYHHHEYEHRGRGGGYYPPNQGYGYPPYEGGYPMYGQHMSPYHPQHHPQAMMQQRHHAASKMRVHVYMNGYGFSRGKAVTFYSVELESMDDLISIILAKFNLGDYDTPTLRSKVLLYCLQGTEIDELEDINNEDVLFLVKPNQIFKPPLPIPHLIQLSSQPIDMSQVLYYQQQSRYALRQQSEYHNFFADFYEELYLHVFSFLDHRDIGLRVGLVNRYWNKLANKNILWKNLTHSVYTAREKRRVKRLAETKQDETTDDDNEAKPAPPPPPLQQGRIASGRSAAGAITSNNTSKRKPPAAVHIPLDKIEAVFDSLPRPPTYKSWKTFYRYYVLWSGALTWNTTERGPNIKFTNDNHSVLRNDNIHYHWQTVRGSLPIEIPTQEERRYNGVDDGLIDDHAIYEWEIEVNRFDTTASNGWWIVFGLETDDFTYKESTPTNLIGYDLHLGYGYAAGNGDSLHCYSNHALKLKQPYTCDPVNAWVSTPFKEKDVVRARLHYGTKLVSRDSLDPAEHIGATLDFYLNGEYLGQAFRNITGRVYPALSLLPNQIVTLRHVDPIAEHYRDTFLKVQDHTLEASTTNGEH